MIVRNIKDIDGTEREVITDNWTSRRMLLKKDGMGFSMHETVIRAGVELKMHYKHHLEAVYCTEGEGTLHDLENDRVYEIKPGFLYALNGNERHILKTTKDCMRMVCVFTPPLNGGEVHGEDGAYPVTEDK